MLMEVYREFDIDQNGGVGEAEMFVLGTARRYLTLTRIRTRSDGTRVDPRPNAIQLVPDTRHPGSRTHTHDPPGQGLLCPLSTRRQLGHKDSAWTKEKNARMVAHMNIDPVTGHISQACTAPPPPSLDADPSSLAARGRDKKTG